MQGGSPDSFKAQSFLEGRMIKSKGEACEEGIEVKVLTPVPGIHHP